MASSFDQTHYPLLIDGALDDDFLVVSAAIREGYSRISEVSVEVVSPNAEVDLNALLGKQICISLSRVDDDARRFPGTCVSVETLGRTEHLAHYLLEIRPWAWFLGRTEECRIFHDMSVIDIFDTILTDYNFSGRVFKKLSNTYPVREFTVQYRESDFDFISRLFEEAGLFYFFRENRADEDTMVLIDDIGGYFDTDGAGRVPFRPRGQANADQAYVYEWRAGLGATTGKVMLADYNFESPGTKLQSSKIMTKGDFSLNDRESYSYPGRFREAAQGDEHAKVRMEAEAVRHHLVAGAANFPGFRVGQKFGVTDLIREEETGEFKWLMIAATHRFWQPIDVGSTQVKPRAGLGAFDEDGDLYRIDFEAIPADVQYRAPLVTPWPEIVGIQTAVVTGGGGEIHTDEHGRVCVQFHWDRDGKNDENSSCWVRVASPWTGSGWGMIHIPRIGQEVVVQFEDGDPDRPLVTGMVWNADTMPPYKLPVEKTKMGIKTNKSEGGGGFHELMFDDKAGEELVRFQSERDYEQIVKNNATISVGEGHKDKGDMTLDVHRNLTETVKTGNHTFKVASGSQTINVKWDKTETIEGKSKLTVTDHVTQEVKMGNVSEKISKGNYEREISQGNETHTIKMGNEERQLNMGNFTQTLNMGKATHNIKMGNFTVKADLGKILLEAPVQGIELKCGMSSLKVDMAGVTIKGPMINVEGSAMTNIKGPMTKVQGQGMLILKGGVMMIN